MKRKPIVLFREFWGASKRADLVASLNKPDFDAAYERLASSEANRFVLRPGAATADYGAWPDVRGLAAVPPLNGPIERRALALIDSDRAKLENRMKKYFDKTISDEEILTLHPSLLMVGNEIDGPRDRQVLLSKKSFNKDSIIRFTWKPFDQRWCYWDNISPLFSRPNPELIKNRAIPDNFYFISRDDADASKEGPPSWITNHVADYDLLRGHARFFPVEILQKNSSGPSALIDQSDMFGASGGLVSPNLSNLAHDYLRQIGFHADRNGAAIIWRHAAAITYSQAYLAENAAGIRQGWPRIPLPADAALLRRSAALGSQLATLLDPDVPVDGVTHGKIRPELAAIAVPSGHNYALTAGWGTRTDKGITMPGRGRSVERPYGEAETATAHKASLLGTTTRDVYLNAESLWANIPSSVWDTHIGGYQVIKKWLSYREKSIIDRALNPDEVLHITQTARRIAAILLLGPELDESYRACAASHGAPTDTGPV